MKTTVSDHWCARCERPLRVGIAAHLIEVSIDGDVIPEGDSRSGGPESLGGLIVGPECYRIVLKRGRLRA